MSATGANSNVLRTFRPGTYVPAFTRAAIEAGAPTRKYSLEDLKNTSFDSGSFRYDQIGTGLKSTQQLNVDWSSFSNHVYFNSAEVVVNVGFDTLINGYPFDGTRREHELFIDNLSGFEKWLLDQFPKNKGFLYFSGSNSPTPGTFIEVKDYAGSEFPSISRDKSGKSILNPDGKSLSIECHVFVPTISNSEQVILQKLSGSSQGFTLGLKPNVSTTEVEAFFAISSGSTTSIVSGSLTKGQFNHIVVTYDRTKQDNKLYFYNNEKQINVSQYSIAIDNFDFILSPLYIGSGSTMLTQMGPFVPTQTFSGALDELRIFHDVRTPAMQKSYGYKHIFADSDLKLYYKFNEPAVNFGVNSSDQINRIVLDSSGNSLHSYIDAGGFSFNLRESGTLTNPMTHERLLTCPVLFPGHPDVIDLNTTLLTTASLYDVNNPNLITKLIPKHYLLEGQEFQGFENEEGTITEGYGGTGIPGQGELGSVQLLTSLLYVMARHFDELKVFVGAMGDMIFVNYDDYDTAPDQMLNFVASYYGVALPGMFTNANISQFIDAEDMTRDFGYNEYSLQTIQNQIWRRILTNLNEIIRSKGTIHSIKAFIRTLGIDPDQNFRIREYGGVTKATLEASREDKSTVTKMLDVSGSTTTYTITSSPLVAIDRVEPGHPYITSTPNDLLLTSGSWTYEATYRFPSITDYTQDQSLVRFCVTGSSLPTESACTFNLVARPNVIPTSASIELYAKPGWDVPANKLTLILTGVNVFDDERWLVSFGRVRNDDPDNVHPNAVSSSYFLRAYKNNGDQLVSSHVTTSFFHELEDNDHLKNSLQTIDPVYNASGTILTYGNTSHDFTLEFLSGTVEETTLFEGRISDIRFWSRALTEADNREHARNFKSLGVERPNVNFNFETTATGSFGRLRLDVSCDQDTITSDGLGSIQLFDYSQNEYHLLGESFQQDTTIILPQICQYSIISPKFDESTEMNKIRVRGFSQYANAELYGGVVGEVYETSVTEIIKDDPRFVIDVSVVDALNEDIIKIFSTLKQLDNMLGNPELLFSEDYPGLEVLRNMYFNRLTDKINLRGFFEFFKWFDVSVGMFIEQLIPRKTKYLGTNYVVESHMLERPKLQYKYENMYLGDNVRKSLNSDPAPVILPGFVTIP